MKIAIATTGAPRATGPFSQGIITDGLIFTAGQIHLSPDGTLLDAPMEKLVERVMENLKAILADGGAAFADVLKTTIYVTDMSTYGTINEVYGRYMQEPFPAREVVCVKELPLGAKVEISMVAVKR